MNMVTKPCMSFGFFFSRHVSMSKYFLFHKLVNNLPRIGPRFGQKHSTMADQHKIVWVDLEMTGLDIENDHIIEMACIITDGNLNIIEEAPDLIIHQSDEIMSNMGEWCTRQHGKSGLTKAVLESKLSLTQAEDIMLEFIKKHTSPKSCPLGGNSVHADKRFLDKYMPRFMDHLHYRIIDVSTIKELCRRWYPDNFSNCPPKSDCHRALEDIHASIKELKYYRGTVFR